jgi:hypothetical protein
VQHPAPPREVLRRCGLPVELHRQGVEHVTDHGGVLEGADGPGCLLDPPDGLRLSLVQLPRVPALVERNASEASMRELLGRSRAACC